MSKEKKKIQEISISENSDDSEYEVERIVDKQLRNGKAYYLVKWKGYTEKSNSWEPI